METISGFIWLGLLIALYWLPTVVAVKRRLVNLGPTIVVNGFLGWTGIGWVVALAMSLGRAQPKVGA